MTTPFVQCPDCEGEAIIIGPIPATDVFAGQVCERPLSGGALYRCRQCSLGFRWPRLGKDELDSMYEQGGELTWTALADSRQDWFAARGWLNQLLPTESRILDVGCFDGGFLEPLRGSYRCFGIEIHAAARDRAVKKGIDVIGTDFSAVAGTFDCVTAFDVIEHVERPKSFLRDCIAAVRPGGWVLISTGNLDAFTFRLMGSRYWYCSIAEHISFVSPAWFSGLADALGFQVVMQKNFSHSNSTMSRRIRQAVNNLLYRINPTGFRLLRKLGMGGKDVTKHPELADHPPGWESAHDHYMVLLKKQ
ncbi:2-polyprenyl-3-methyl-5-hydroxy-6-metoxy-1 4-benzoquinol methylase-like protein [Thioalkalivibrio sulfidiphilus HL-EbGr7]|uniref:2-polyprenyl-3-methyl-5-hydroxy-6-metoxy-1 4-benzoquinol methylase-like protein n=2 Tax=Thioalkalivibrio TaxID=106633 RepID=B8GTU0_THISH|nr:2-polyprenyl-3-methyl-5-hydroxy-6-metoxy-1 4-benzoquinol methylase-like protein [Thioalkalivibrio sulfidiphilus HL-EbGr7]